MTIRALITEGIGPGSSIKFLLTEGLDIGAAVAVTVDYGGIRPPTEAERKRAKRIALERERMRQSTWAESRESRANLRSELRAKIAPPPQPVTAPEPVAAKPKRRIADDDDEREVELLLLSL